MNTGYQCQNGLIFLCPDNTPLSIPDHHLWLSLGVFESEVLLPSCRGGILADLLQAVEDLFQHCPATTSHVRMLI